MRVWASQKEKTSLGPVMSSCHAVMLAWPSTHRLRERKMATKRTLGTSPLKKLPKPSLRAMLDRILNPLSGLSKLRF